MDELRYCYCCSLLVEVIQPKISGEKYILLKISATWRIRRGRSSRGPSANIVPLYELIDPVVPGNELIIIVKTSAINGGVTRGTRTT